MVTVPLTERLLGSCSGSRKQCWGEVSNEDRKKIESYHGAPFNGIFSGFSTTIDP